MVGIAPVAHDRYQSLMESLYRRELFGIRLGLGTTRRILTSLDRPERRFPSILVAGTNGKGSTAAMISSILRAAGMRVGLFTSPHLLDYRERIRIDGRALTREELLDLAEPMLPLLERTGATYFEAATALAFQHFAACGVDVAVVEVGLGGRLDSTNTLPRPLAVITDVDRDHVERLGKTLPEIAWEKAGIIRARGRAVSGCRRPAARRVLRSTARRRGAGLIELDQAATAEVIARAPEGSRFRSRTERGDYGELALALPGDHQVRNASLALLAAELWLQDRGGLAIEAAREGLAAARWPGRMETISHDPRVVIDVAHNPHGAEAVARTLSESFGATRPVLLFGCLAGKDFPRMLRALLPRVESAVFARASTSRSTAEPERLAREAARRGVPAIIEEDLPRALDIARERAGRRGMVLVTGSAYLVGDVMSVLGIPVPEAI